MSWIDIIADRKIRDAQEEGAFEDLPGKGKPLKLEYDPRVPPEQRATYRLMKEADLLPEWIQMDKEIRTRLEQWEARIETYAAARAAQTLATPPGEKRDPKREAQRIAARDAERDAFILRTVEGMRDLNRLIDRFNLVVPTPSKQPLRLQLRERAAELEARFPRATPRPGGAPNPWNSLLDEDRPPTKLSNRMPVRLKQRTLG